MTAQKLAKARSQSWCRRCGESLTKDAQGQWVGRSRVCSEDQAVMNLSSTPMGHRPKGEK